MVIGAVFLLGFGASAQSLDDLFQGAGQFEWTKLPDGTLKTRKIVFRTGARWFDVTKLSDGTLKVGRKEFPNGIKWFDWTRLSNGKDKVARIEYPGGKILFDLTSNQYGALVPVRTGCSQVGCEEALKHFDLNAPSCGFFHICSCEPTSIRQWSSPAKVK